MKKQNVFDDFIAAAEYLIAENYTSSDYLAIRGGSNGGLLVGATMTQRPDLMRVALPAVGSWTCFATTPLPQEQAGPMIMEQQKIPKKCSITSRAIHPCTTCVKE